MKKLLLAALVLSLSVAQLTRADNNNGRKTHKRQADSAAVARPQRSGQGQQAGKPVQQQAKPKVQPAQRNTGHVPRSVAPSQRQAVQSEAQLEGRNHNRVQPSNQGGSQNPNVNRNRGNAQGKGGKRTFNRNSFAVACGNINRTPHNRNWWRSRYNTTFVLFGGGYYYWWGDYWYPAFGYSPYYNSYIYSEPIYGYDNLDPGQVIENVQVALRDQGYYPGAIDGLIGPQTRAALAAFQRDHGLIITEAVDEPTLVTLGLT